MAALFVLEGIIGCSWVRDDLTDCPQGCRVQLHVDSKLSAAGNINAMTFAEEVQDVMLFVFDCNETYVGCFSEQGDSLKQKDYIIDIPVGPGHYSIVAWTGLADDDYILSYLEEGVSKLTDLEVMVERDEHNRQEDYLHPMWHGLIRDIEVKPHCYPLYNMGLRKSNKTFVVVLQDMVGNSIEAEALKFEIHSANGRMAYDHSLLADDELCYCAYHVSTVDLSGYDEARAESEMDLVAARAELNTLRLVEDNSTRLIIKNSEGRKMLDIDLLSYILLTREQYEGKVGVKLTDQQYLDYEDHYSMIFMVMPSGNASDPYSLVELRINGWILRPQNAIF